MIPGAVVDTQEGREINIPEKMLCLFEPYRYKVFHGGRGGGKSHSVAKALLVLGATERLRVLCTREVQKSIKDSVKKLLDDQIELLGLGWFYQSLETEIRGRNGTEILFAGLSGQTADSLKSYEGVDVCWVEEAHGVTDSSWKILTPTIRKPDSEIWITFNPSLDTDPVWKRFVENPPPGAKVVQINWSDNPWFPEVLEQERQHCKVAFPDDYDNIWEGKCRSAVEGAIYASEVQQAVQDGRICPVPYNPKLKVHAIWDMGWNDSMSIVLVQKSGPSQIAVIGYIEDKMRTLDSYVGQLNAMNYNWGYDWLPHDAKHKDFKTGVSSHQILRRLKRKTKEIAQIGVEPGIRLARMLFPRCYFDKAQTARLVECLKRYRRAIPTTTGEPGSPVHDEYSHACLIGSTLIKTRRGDVMIKDVLVGDQVWTPAGWSDVINSGPTKYANELVEIITEDGRKLVATPEHKVLTQRGFVCVNALRYNDRVFNGQELPCTLSKFVSMVTRLGFRETITGEMSGVAMGRQTCIERFGSFITEKSLRALRCITRTAIRLTTTLPTWNAYQCTSISGSICLSDLSVERRNHQASTLEQGRLSGTSLQRVKSGTLSTARPLGIIESGMRSLARIAVKCIARLTLLVPSSATRIASKRLYASEEGKTLVYDLTVRKNACYLANEVLVSNCDAFRYLAVVADKLSNEMDDVDQDARRQVVFEVFDSEMGF